MLKQIILLIRGSLTFSNLVYDETGFEGVR